MLPGDDQGILNAFNRHVLISELEVMVPVGIIAVFSVNRNVVVQFCNRVGNRSLVDTGKSVANKEA